MKQTRTRSAGITLAIQAADNSITELAKRIGVTPQAVSGWEEVPLARCLAVEAATGVSRARLRPDVFGDWPGRKRSAARAAA